MRITIVLLCLLFSCCSQAQQPGAEACYPTFPQKKTPRKAEDPTPTDLIPAISFEGNKGKLNWPVANGYICDHFGTHPHPLPPHFLVDNDDIDIRTIPDAQVRAVFEGEVSSVIVVGDEKIVLIRHGGYFTVYNNLSSASVSKGQHVTSLQPIGVAHNNDEGEPTVQFGIWKSDTGGAVAENPESWLARVR